MSGNDRWGLFFVVLVTWMLHDRVTSGHQKTFRICGRFRQGIPVMQIPDRYERVKSLPDDPPCSRAYGYGTSGAECFALVCPIPAEQAMPYGNPQEVIDGIHRTLGDDQGLIEVEAHQRQLHHFLSLQARTPISSFSVSSFLSNTALSVTCFGSS